MSSPRDPLPAWARVLTMYTHANVVAVLARRHLSASAREVLRANSVLIELCVLSAEAHYGFDLPAYVLVSLLPSQLVRRVGVPPLAAIALVADLILHAAPVALMGLPVAWWTYPAATAMLLTWYAIVRSTVGLRAVYWRRAPDTEFVDYVLFKVVPAIAIAVAIATWAAHASPPVAAASTRSSLWERLTAAFWRGWSRPLVGASRRRRHAQQEAPPPQVGNVEEPPSSPPATPPSTPPRPATPAPPSAPPSPSASVPGPTRTDATP